MMPHLPFTFLLAALTAGASALPGARAARERLYRALYLFFASVFARPPVAPPHQPSLSKCLPPFKVNRIAVKGRAVCFLFFPRDPP